MDFFKDKLDELVLFIQTSPVKSALIFLALIAVQGFIVSGGVEYLKRKFKWQDRDLLINGVVLFISTIVTVGEVGKGFIESSAFASTATGTFVMAVFTFFIGMKKIGDYLAARRLEIAEATAEIRAKRRLAVPQGREITNDEIWSDQI